MTEEPIKEESDESALSEMFRKMAETEVEPLLPTDFPLTVDKSEDMMVRFRELTGDLKKIMHPVAIRPIDEELNPDKKTFLGFYLGDYIRSISFLRVKEKDWPDFKLSILLSNNPAIYVPDLKTVVWGDSSWWDFVKNEEDIRKISDDDIQNIWYVKALKALAENGKGEK